MKRPPPRTKARATERKARPPARAGGAPARSRPFMIPVALALVLAGVLVVHGPAVPRPFFADDYLFLEQVRGRGPIAALFTPDPIGNFIRPVSRALWFSLTSTIFGEKPFAFHAMNLALFAASLAVLFAILRRRLGAGPACCGVAFVALHYAADVPLRWASGSQDLLATLFAALAVWLHMRERRLLAALALALALLSKEVVAGTVLIAMAADHDPARGWRATLRRGAGLLAVTMIWAVAWGATFSRSPAAGAMSGNPMNLAAAFVHLFQVAAGLEFRAAKDAFGHWSVVALVPAALAATAALLAAGNRAGVAEPARARRRALFLGVVWIAAAALPLVPVMPIWSAYFYLWALFGVALLLATLVAGLPRVATAALIGGLVLLSANARRLDEFALRNDPWLWQSHVDRHYIDRALGTIETYLADMKRARPQLPPRSTVFFANVASASGWQTADGPLVRWAYQDSTLRGYYMGQFTKALSRRGPMFFFSGEQGRLVDKTDHPDLLFSFAYSMMLAGKDERALEVLDVIEPKPRVARQYYYWRGLVHLALGMRDSARADFVAAQLGPTGAVRPGAEAMLRAAPDTVAKIALLRDLRAESVLSPWVHGQLAPLLLGHGPVEEGVTEAYAYRVLEPDDPGAWHTWASAQLAVKHNEAALATLEKYLAMLPPRGRTDPNAEEVAALLRRMLYGDIAHQGLRGRKRSDVTAPPAAR